MEIIEEITKITQIRIMDNIKEKFWDMFIIDGLIGNTDRHNGNWGFLVNTKSNEALFSPIYDCGSSLNPMLEDEEIKELNEVEMKNLAINCYSCIKQNGKKINYISYMKSQEIKNAIKQLKEYLKKSISTRLIVL